MPKFSVIVPCYNVAPYLEGCLKSLESQSFADWEAIFIDDGSSDGTNEILNQFPSRDLRVRVHRQSNAGVSTARNVGLDVAQGEYILFLDADDTFVPWAMETLVGVIDCAHSPDVIMFGHEDVISAEDPLPDRKEDCAVICFALCADSEAQAAFYRVAGNLIAWNGCFRRESLDGIRFRPYRNGEDVLFGLSAFCVARSVAITGAVLYRYLNRPGSAVHMNTLEHLVSICEVAQEQCAIVERWSQSVHIRRLFKKKLEVSLAGYAYGAYMALSPVVRHKGFDRMINSILQITRKYPWALGRGQAIGINVTSCLKSRLLLFVVLRLPFVLRVTAVKMLRRIK